MIELVNTERKVTPNGSGQWNVQDVNIYKRIITLY